MATTANYAFPTPESADPAKVPEHMKALAVPIDAKLAELEARVAEREKVYIAHEGDGSYSFKNGLGELLRVNAGTDGDWEVIV